MRTALRIGTALFLFSAGTGNPALVPLAAKPVSSESPAKERRPRPLTSAVAARKAFRAEAERIFLKTSSLRTQQYWQARLASLEDRRKWSVRRQSFAEAGARVDDTLTEKERQTQIRYGTLAGLRAAQGDCWALEYSDYPETLIAYLEAGTGRLVFLWYPPEG